ncbi:anti-sigma factor family protein [Streptomyces sp. TR06-5]|uniref:anti-sigma factor family protein n=1 Tax=unclassified Streptomyces TaxID=2593676 RepID=UPI0039A3B7EE
MSDGAVPDPHTDVGAYALGLLTDTEAARFEEHLADCPRCAAELEADLELRTVLREAAEDGGLPFDGPPAPPLDRLLARVSRARRRERRRRGVLLAAALAAVLAAVVVTVESRIGEAADPAPAATARAAFRQGEKHRGGDPVTGVRAAVSLRERPWGTRVALRIGNLTGPRACALVAVGDNGSRQTVTSWSVPGYGYGIRGTAYDEPLYVEGGAALRPERIDHFEVRTLRGEKLAAIRL